MANDTIDRGLGVGALVGALAAAILAAQASGDAAKAAEDAQKARENLCPMIITEIIGADKPQAVWAGLEDKYKDDIKEECNYHGP